jgi:hypothetical protein
MGVEICACENCVAAKNTAEASMPKSFFPIITTSTAKRTARLRIDGRSSNVAAAADVYQGRANLSTPITQFKRNTSFPSRFQRNLAPESRVFGQICLSHSAGTEFRDDAVVRESGASTELLSRGVNATASTDPVRLRKKSGQMPPTFQLGDLYVPPTWDERRFFVFALSTHVRVEKNQEQTTREPSLLLVG